MNLYLFVGIDGGTRLTTGNIWYVLRRNDKNQKTLSRVRDRKSVLFFTSTALCGSPLRQEVSLSVRLENSSALSSHWSCVRFLLSGATARNTRLTNEKAVSLARR